MAFAATGLYVGLNALLLLVLILRVVRLRWRHNVSLGDGEVEALRRAIRGHGNAAEILPLALLVIAALEAQGAPVWALHALGGALTVGRLSHAFAFAGPRRLPFRMAGMTLTIIVYAAGGLGLLWLALTA